MDRKTLIKIFAFPIFVLISITLLVLGMPLESAGEKFLILSLMFVSLVSYTIILLDL